MVLLSIYILFVKALKIPPYVLILTVFCLLIACNKKSDSDNSNSIATGTYTGIYADQDGSGQTFNNFKIQISKVGDKRYSIKPISTGTLPTFYFDVMIEQPGAVQCRIPQQTSGSMSFVGYYYGIGNYDLFYLPNEKKVLFTIQVQNSVTRTLQFTGVKE